MHIVCGEGRQVLMTTCAVWFIRMYIYSLWRRQTLVHYDYLCFILFIMLVGFGGGGGGGGGHTRQACVPKGRRFMSCNYGHTHCTAHNLCKISIK